MQIINYYRFLFRQCLYKNGQRYCILYIIIKNIKSFMCIILESINKAVSRVSISFRVTKWVWDEEWAETSQKCLKQCGWPSKNSAYTRLPVGFASCDQNRTNSVKHFVEFSIRREPMTHINIYLHGVPREESENGKRKAGKVVGKDGAERGLSYIVGIGAWFLKHVCPINNM